MSSEATPHPRALAGQVPRQVELGSAPVDHSAQDYAAQEYAAQEYVAPRQLRFPPAAPAASYGCAPPGSELVWGMGLNQGAAHT